MTGIFFPFQINNHSPFVNQHRDSYILRCNSVQLVDFTFYIWLTVKLSGFGREEYPHTSLNVLFTRAIFKPIRNFLRKKHKIRFGKEMVIVKCGFMTSTETWFDITPLFWLFTWLFSISAESLTVIVVGTSTWVQFTTVRQRNVDHIAVPSFN